MTPINKNSFLDELELIQKEAEGMGDWVAQHPVVTGLGLAGLGAGGVAAKRLLTKAAPSVSPAMKRLRNIAESQGLKAVMEVPLNKGKPGLAGKIRAHLSTLGAMDPVYLNPRGNYIGHSRGKLKGVTFGAYPGTSQAELQVGGLSNSKKIREAVKSHDRMDRGGKVYEASKDVGVQDLMAPGTSAANIAEKYKIKVPTSTASTKAKAQFFQKLQASLKKEYGDKGFFAKPHGVAGQAGAFASEKGKWGDMYGDYHKRLKSELQRKAQELRKTPSSWPMDARLRKEFEGDPAYSAHYFDKMLKDLGRTKVEQKLPVVPSMGKAVEFRLHTIGGDAPKELSYYRNFRHNLGTALNKKRFGSPEEASAWVKKNVLPRLPENLRSGSFAMDVMRVKQPNGRYGYKLVEFNPTSGNVIGVGSGFADPLMNPMSPHRVYKAIHGKDSPAMTTLKALAAGGTLGVGGGLTASQLKNRER